MYSGLFFLRLAVGAIFICHSIPKLKDPKSMASGISWSSTQVLGLGMIEFISALGILGGIATKLSALVLMVVMLGAIYYKIKKWHIPFMGVSTTGWEFDFLLFCASLTIYLRY